MMDNQSDSSPDNTQSRDNQIPIMLMSTTNKKQSADKQQDRSNVLSLLKTLERIYTLCQDVLNTHAQTALMLSLAIEAEMLLLKLGVMRDRWQYHLPFKEAVKVRFGVWSDKIEKMAASFAEKIDATADPINPYCPSKHYMLDLHGILPEIANAEGYAPYYHETVTSRFLVNQERIRRQITDQWATHYQQRFSDFVTEQLEQDQNVKLDNLRNNDETIRKACHNVLMALASELAQLNELAEPDIPEEQFVRLAERVLGESDHDGQSARKQARRDVFQWKNQSAKRLREQKRRGEIDASIKIIEEMGYAEQLRDDIGDDLDIKGHFEGLGRFLHRVRGKITSEGLNDLMYQLFRIRYFTEEKERQTAAEAEKATSAVVFSSFIFSLFLILSIN